MAVMTENLYSGHWHTYCRIEGALGMFITIQDYHDGDDGDNAPPPIRNPPICRSFAICRAAAKPITGAQQVVAWLVRTERRNARLK